MLPYGLLYPVLALAGAGIGFWIGHVIAERRASGHTPEKLGAFGLKGFEWGTALFAVVTIFVTKGGWLSPEQAWAEAEDGLFFFSVYLLIQGTAWFLQNAKRGGRKLKEDAESPPPG